MPVFRREFEATNQWDHLVRDLAQELQVSPLSGDQSSNSGRPLVFEDQLAYGSVLQVIVVWDAWAEVPPASRGNIILEAYRQIDPMKVEMVRFPVGLTYEEAIQGGYLPYIVQPNAFGIDRKFLATLKTAMTEVGGRISYGQSGEPELRFPFRSLADQAAQALEQRFGRSTFNVIEETTYTFGG